MNAISYRRAALLPFRQILKDSSADWRGVLLACLRRILVFTYWIMITDAWVLLAGFPQGDDAGEISDDFDAWKERVWNKLHGKGTTTTRVCACHACQHTYY